MKLLECYHEKNTEAGCDEAGRGCIAGPVVAATVVLPKSIDIPNLNDSKKLSANKRYNLREIIQQKAICWAIGIVDNKEIDRINILNATFLAMHKAIESLEIEPQTLLIDGNRFLKYKNIEHICIVKGDQKYASIAAASIIAKTYRDDIMNELHKEYPKYYWNKNKGYPTAEHRNAIKEYGTTPLHRITFNLLPNKITK